MKKYVYNLFFFVVFFSACTTSVQHKKEADVLTSPQVEKKLENDNPEVSRNTLAFVWPVEGKPRIGSFFGWRKKGKKRKSGERMHEGIDIGGYRGQPIYAAASGTVISTSTVSGYGNTVVIYHGEGWSTLYAHLTRYKVKKGDDVKEGALVGLMGRTGRAYAVHLHFEIRKGSDPLDPLLFLPSRELEKYAPKNFYWDEGSD